MNDPDLRKTAVFDGGVSEKSMTGQDWQVVLWNGLLGLAPNSACLAAVDDSGWSCTAAGI